MAKKPIASPEVLRQLLRYETETGKLFWRRRSLEMFKDARSRNSWNARYSDQEAFIKKERDGYLRGSILGDLYLAHRVIWAMESGEWPLGVIDHIDGVTDNNRMRNLRAATQAQNTRNRRSHKGSKSSYLGVCWHKRSGKWTAAITTDFRTQHLGLFSSEEDAARAYDDAAVRLHGAFASKNLGGSV